MKVVNKQIIYKQTPKPGPINPDEVFVHKQVEIDLNQELPANHILVENLYLAVGPYMRNKMRDPKIPSYTPPFTLNGTPDAACLCKVVKSNDDKHKVGDIVMGLSNWENYSVVPGKVYRKVQDIPGVPLSAYLGVLGMNGLTAWAGLHYIGTPKAGETVFVSGAYGAVGLTVGQICKAKGLRVVGIAGDDEKVKGLLDAGFDAAFNYKTVGNFKKTLKEYCPNGIDIYWDNVGGQILNDSIILMNDFGRIISCGMISQYNAEKPFPITNLILTVSKRLRIQGFIASDHYKDFPQFWQEVIPLVTSGKVKIIESIDEGVDNIPASLLKLFKGENKGQQLVKLAKL